MNENTIKYSFDPSISYGFLTRYRAAASMQHGILGFFSSLMTAWNTRHKTSEAVREFFIKDVDVSDVLKVDLSHYGWKKHWPDFAPKMLSACSTIPKEEMALEKYQPRVKDSQHDLLQGCFKALALVLYKRVSCDESEHSFSINQSLLTQGEMARILVAGAVPIPNKADEQRVQELFDVPMVKKIMEDRIRLITILGGTAIQSSSKRSPPN
jgi:hypothetical protein